MKILITGASSGIGFLTGCVLSERGHDVVLTTKTDLEAKLLKQKVSKLELNIFVVKFDITNDNDLLEVKELFESIDVLFLHAGVGNIGLLSDMNLDLIKESFEVNVFSNLKIIQEFIKYDNKKVVMTSSLLSNTTFPFFGVYSMTKNCIDIIIKTLRKENIFNNNKFVLVKPGAYHTGFNQNMVLSLEKSNVDPIIVSLLNKLFLFIEEKDIKSVVYKNVMAIEKGQGCYSVPLNQAFIISFFKLICGNF